MPFEKWASYGVVIPNPYIDDMFIKEKTDRWLKINRTKSLNDYHEEKCKLFSDNIKRFVFYLFTHSLTHSLNHSLTHSLTHSITQSINH